ncbi:MAG: pilus assembly protein [Selenomonadaceae bacterium]|nr:pilus assembly protein [Selenomonadaceae bacterium]
MKKYLRRRGQAAVEFALLLPIFALVLFSTIYIGFFVLDYVTLDNAAAQAARNAVKNGDPYDITNTDSARIKAIGNKLFLTWYELRSECITISQGNIDETTKDFVVVPDGIYVRVMIRADLKEEKEHTILAGIMPEAYTVSKIVQIEESAEPQPGQP